ncbi:CehA/McbA family metallohydrolase [Bythopirellula polymerisocia]|uniref:Uncharacterized protein n=1 Tax=Bythopirellula polymerisocia TaxID=2528003 RepID=A0A5C6CXX5_9BACT|nr:CehA/McbA family metallohydrolase [Bythopirellula polymerisocia]TWU27499.1 hypothetical protein Pla144_22730 [Bythopirellula polymerisocia]
MNFAKALLVALSLSSLAQAEKFLLEVVNEVGKPLPARVRVRDEAGKDYCPSGSRIIPVGNDDWFVTGGISVLEIPTGKVEIRIEHGLEYQPAKQLVTCDQRQTNRHTVQLKRWINMRDHGFLCGENHLHVPLDELAPQLVAEGLDFGTSLQWWNARRYDVSPPGGPVRYLEYAGRSIPTTVYDYELEHDWGAVYVIGQPRPLAIGNEPDQPNLPVISKSHDEGALVCYQGGWSREVLLDALLGYVDVVNVCNNNFLRYAYQPRSRYSNLLQVPGFPVYENNADDMLRMNTDTYYRLLNCGLHLAAGAGSATGPKKTPVGYNRTYVRVDRDATVQEFLEGWRQGKNFVTNGPMLFLEIDDQYRPGDTIEMTAVGATLNIEVAALFPYLISNIEIVLNGQVVQQVSELESGTTTKVPIRIEESSWLAARCTAEDQLLSDAELAAYEWGTEEMPRKPTRLRFAHTSPIYISLDGKQAHVEESIREAHQMLDAIAVFAEERTSGETRLETARWIEEAREKLSD